MSVFVWQLEILDIWFGLMLVLNVATFFLLDADRLIIQYVEIAKMLTLRIY
jgi:hypothetical protein